MITTRNLFKLAVRILGLVFLYHGLNFLPTLLTGIFGGGFSALGTSLMIAWPLLVAVCLLRFAPTLTNLFYPKSED